MLDHAQDERAIFFAALQCPAGPERDAYLRDACNGESDLLCRVRRLISLHEQSQGPLDLPPPGLCIAATTNQPTECVGTMVGPYKLLEQIGEGGMGLVYMAEQQRPMKRLVALKLIKPGMDSRQVIARFEAEKQALAMMDHPNIAKVFDAGTIGGEGPGTSGQEPTMSPSLAPGSRPLAPSAGRPYFAMELVRGIPINEFCDQKRLGIRERLEQFIQVCQAVQHAHQKGIIHRDLKPTNVLVTLLDVLAVPKVIDFGIAKALGAQLTEHTLHTGYAQLVGTPLYMSPEQAEMNQLGVDTRSDVYSLGVLLYELLTGTTPFDKDRLQSATFDEMRRMIREDEPETVSMRLAKTRNSSGVAVGRAANHGRLLRLLFNPKSKIQNPKLFELDWIVMKALEKDRSRRYESASALAADIQRYLSDEPVLACPPTTMYRFQKFARKHKPALATAAVIAASLLLGTTVSAWQAARATQAEAQANANANQAQEKAQEANQQRDEAQKQRDEVKTLNEKLKATQAELRRTLYAAHMNLAKTSWDTGGIVRVQELLEQYRTKPGENDLRGFEWHYLRRLCHSELLTLKHSGEVNSVAYSPDGKRLASAGGGTAKIWDAQTGQELFSFHAWGAVVFSPDGKRIAIGVSRGSEGEWKIRDAQTGIELLSLKGHYNSMAFSPDGKRLASVGGGVKVWDADTGANLHTLRQGISGGCLVFSPDGRRLACTGAGDGTIRVLDAQTGHEHLTIKAHSVYPQSVAFSPNGKQLAIALEDTTLKVWDAESGQEVRSLEHSGASSVSFSPDGKRLAGGSWTGMLRIWDVETGQAIRTIKGAGSIVVFSPDGQHLASNADQTVKIWDAQKDQESIALQEAGGRRSPDGRLLARASADNTIKIEDTQSGQQIVVLTGHTVPVRILAFSPDGQRLASGGGGRRTADGIYGVGRDDRAELKVWDVQAGKELFNLPVAKGTISTVAFSPNGKRLASSSGPMTVPVELKVWDAQTGQELFSLKGHTGTGSSMIYSADGKRLATSSTDNMVKLWDSETGQELLSFKGQGGWPQPLAFSSDGKRLAGAGTGGVTVWDSETGQELLALKGHSSNVRSVAFNPEGTRLATASNDQMVKLWDAQSGQELLTLEAQWPTNVAFSPDGYRLTVNGNGMKVIYDATPLPEKP